MATAPWKKEAGKVVSHDEWLTARKELLKQEKGFTKLRDELAARRREMPWEEVQKEYVFDGLEGKRTLAELFEERSQLVVYHFMLAPGWKEGCPGCSFLGDTFDGMRIHLEQRDVTFVAVSRATLPEIEEFRKRMGWKFKWLSSNGTDFNFDYHVSFTKEELATEKVNYNYEEKKITSEELPGLSVFYKDGTGAVFHTYSTYARGLDEFLSTYHYLDRTPNGRDEGGLPATMAWVRHHDKYAQSYAATS